MNAKRAKHLRRAARECSIGMPSRYVVSRGQLFALGPRGIYRLLKKGTDR